VYVASNCAQAMRRQQLCDFLLQETREAKFSIDYGASTEAHAVRSSGGPCNVPSDGQLRGEKRVGDAEAAGREVGRCPVTHLRFSNISI
jgi:hypothetical protein